MHNRRDDAEGLNDAAAAEGGAAGRLLLFLLPVAPAPTQADAR